MLAERGSRGGGSGPLAIEEKGSGNRGEDPVGARGEIHDLASPAGFFDGLAHGGWRAGGDAVGPQDGVPVGHGTGGEDLSEEVVEIGAVAHPGLAGRECRCRMADELP